VSTDIKWYTVECKKASHVSSEFLRGAEQFDQVFYGIDEKFEFLAVFDRSEYVFFIFGPDNLPDKIGIDESFLVDQTEEFLHFYEYDVTKPKFYSAGVAASY